MNAKETYNQPPNVERKEYTPLCSGALLGDDNIKNTLMRLEETNDCSWTELCILTVREICKPLMEEIEACKVDRNRIGMAERRRYLPKLIALKKSADELALYLDEYNKQAGESHEPLYWIACRAIQRYDAIKNSVAESPNIRS